MLATQPSEFDAALSGTSNTNNNNGTDAAGVNRNTSVRSVMTLPAYNPKPYDTEQVLGREGERAGMDSVIEYPETNEEEEGRREEEMEALYQVRLARRNEIQERNERRRLRQAAREANDHVALRRLREQEQERERIRAAGNAANAIDELRAQAERAKAKPRAISSVSYGDLGVARHDGTRLRISSDGARQRAGSMESERQGLLGEAADMAESLRGPEHSRSFSNGSIASVDTYNSNDFPLPHLTGSRSNSRPGTPLRINTATTSNTNMPEADLGLERIDFDANRALSALVESPPPGYENVALEMGSPPGYTSPVVTRNSQRFSFPRGNQDTAYHGAAHIQEISSGTGTSESEMNSSPSITTRMESPVQTSATSRSGGIPQLPSLRISNLPSIVVNEASARSPTHNGF